jgi:beta-glucanase (GH16 family)
LNRTTYDAGITISFFDGSRAARSNGHDQQICLYNTGLAIYRWRMFESPISTGCRLAKFMLAAALCHAVMQPRSAAADPASGPLDLRGYHLTFNDDFSKLDISAYGPGTTWIAHTPWNGDFGADFFGNPGPGGPFLVTKDGLSITDTKGADGKWQAGLICSRAGADPDSEGFAQQYGYFEMKAKLPDGPGVWPGFWLVGVDRSQGTSEIDVMEYYGHDNASYRTTEHVWVQGKDQWHHGDKFDVPPGQLTSAYNTYGVLITPDRATFYFNRKAYWSAPLPAQYRQPMYLLADFAIGGFWPYDKLTSPKTMDIAYIRAYAKN